MPEGAVTPHREPSEKEIRLVIAASSAGTIFEWYDFFIYGTLAALIGAAFFPSDNEKLEKDGPDPRVPEHINTGCRRLNICGHTLLPPQAQL